MKMEVDFHLDLTETEADMLGAMIRIYHSIIEIHSNEGLGMEEKFYTQDKNDFFGLVEKLREITGRELDY